jgi:YggT family protein
MAVLLDLIRIVLNGYYVLLIFYVLLSWFPSARRSSAYYYLASLVEPYLSRFRQVIPPIGGLDFSPILAFLLLSFAIRMIPS